MLALFCLRLALGLMACLLIVPARLTHPRYYRTHCLTSLGLAIVAIAFRPVQGTDIGFAVATAAVLALLASILWRINGAPGAQVLNLLSAAAFAWSLVVLEQLGPLHGETVEQSPIGLALVGDVSSALVLGTVVSAMLMGHFYLITPGMPLSPLMHLLGAFGIALVARAAADGFALWRWSAENSLAAAGTEAKLFLTVRWLVGFALPAVVGWMAWQSARIRSTQSATGILYVAVIFCFLGELTALLLREQRGLTL
jgi:hypothetical protein